MTTSEQAPRTSGTPTWLWIAAGLGIVWNVYGVYQFTGSLSKTAEDSMRAGMTQAQAELYLSLPSWITFVFAVGVFGGLAGSIALLARRGVALPVFAVSLVGYVLLFLGDLYYGVFAGIPSQLVVLALVVAIAAALLFASTVARRRAYLV